MSSLNREFRNRLVLPGLACLIGFSMCSCQPSSSQAANLSPTSGPLLSATPPAITVEDISQETAEPAEISRPEPTFVAPVVDYKVVNRYPHDTKAFTQGLLVSPEGDFYESTGLEGHSEVRRVEIKSGKVLQSQKLANSMFGEGLTLVGDELIQLTWKNHKFLGYNRRSLKSTREAELKSEGWGITSTVAAGKSQLIVSDGTSSLTWYDPQTLKVSRRQVVRDGTREVAHINELEMVKDKLWANIWGLPYVAVVDPESAKVEYWVDLRGLLSPSEAAAADVLNGIAYDTKGKRLFVTGKFWPRIFEIEVEAP